MIINRMLEEKTERGYHLKFPEYAKEWNNMDKYFDQVRTRYYKVF